MSIYLAFTAGLAASIDGFMVGTVLGMKKIKISLRSLFLISLIPFGCGLFAAYLGNLATHFMSPRAGNLISGLLLLYLAYSTYVETKKEQQHRNGLQTPAQILSHPQCADTDLEHDIKGGEILTLGFAVAVDAMAVAFSCGLSGAAPLLIGIFMGICHFALIALGTFLGNLAMDFLAKSPLLRNFHYLPCLLYLGLAFLRIR